MNIRDGFITYLDIKNHFIGTNEYPNKFANFNQLEFTARRDKGLFFKIFSKIDTQSELEDFLIANIVYREKIPYTIALIALDMEQSFSNRDRLCFFRESSSYRLETELSDFINNYDGINNPFDILFQALIKKDQSFSVETLILVDWIFPFLLSRGFEKNKYLIRILNRYKLILLQWVNQKKIQNLIQEVFRELKRQ